MTWNERAYIINNIKNVIEVVSFDDSDNTAIDGLVKVQNKYNDHDISFANGGDRIILIPLKKHFVLRIILKKYMKLVEVKPMFLVNY